MPLPKFISWWLPDGSRHAHVVHCHARTSHNCVILAVIQGESLPGVLQLRLSIRLSVILKGRPVSSEPSQPSPGRGSRYCPMRLSCCGGFLGHNVSPQAGGVVYQIQVSARLPASSRTVPAREPSSSLTSRKNGQQHHIPPRSQTYRQPRSEQVTLQTDEAIAAAAFRRAPRAIPPLLS